MLPASGLASNDDIATLHASDPRLAEELEGAEIVPSNESLGMDTDTITPQSATRSGWLPRSRKRITRALHLQECRGQVSRRGQARYSQELRWKHGPTGRMDPEDRCGAKWAAAMDAALCARTIPSARSGRWRQDGRPSRCGKVRASSEDASRTLEHQVQWKHRHAARHASDDADAQGLRRTKANDPTALQHNARDQVISQELDTLRSRAGAQYMPSNYGASMSKEERRALRKAQKEGRLAEEMLDRRTKLKSDKYA